MAEHLIPRNYGHKAFYIEVYDNLHFRVYKVESFFSTVGEAWVMLFYVSFRDLQKLKGFKDKYDNKTICITDIPETEVNHILFQLKKRGTCSIKDFFSH